MKAKLLKLLKSIFVAEDDLEEWEK